MKTSFTSLSCAIVMICYGFGEESAGKAPEMTPEMTAVLANDRAYEEAYARADAAALAAYFAEDAEYTSEDGRSFSGKSAIEVCLRDAFRANKGAKLSIHPDSVRRLSPDVVVEKGSTSVTSKSGGEAQSLYMAVHVKIDDKWKISQLVETPMPAATPHERLAEVAWLIGDWNEADPEAGVAVQSRYQWARGGNFISRNVTVKRGEDPVLEGWQVVGWNPVDERIQSWTFDDAGGFTEGRWTREGQRWLIRESGYAADGSRSTADNTLTKAGPDRLFWESANRTLDGDPQPSIGRIEILRKKGE